MTADLSGWGDYGLAGLKVLLAVLLLAGLWVLLDVLTRFDDEQELFARRNVAYGVVRGAIVLAQAIAVMPLVATRTGRFLTDVRPLVGWGLGVLVVLLVLTVVVDRVTGRAGGADARSGVPMPTAVVQAGLFLATGLIFNGALSGTAPDLGTAVAATIVFGVLGVGALLAGYLLIGAVRLLRPAGVTGLANTSAALVDGGFLVALGLILRTSIAGDFTGWGSGLIGFVVTFVAGFVALILLLLLIDRVVIRSRTLRQIVAEDNTLAAALMAVILISIGLAIDAVVI